MAVSNVSEAIQVLSAAHHRGAWGWSWNPTTLRVEPWGWSALDFEPAPTYTAFEALAIARGLVEIGAVQPLDAPRWHVGALP